MKARAGVSSYAILCTDPVVDEHFHLSLNTHEGFQAPQFRTLARGPPHSTPTALTIGIHGRSRIRPHARRCEMRYTTSFLPRTIPGGGATRNAVRNLVLCSVLLAWAGPAMDARLHVPSKKYPTIQTAIDMAQPNDEIAVAPGTYNEMIDFHGKAVRLYGRKGAAATTINGGGNGSVVTCANGETSGTILEGFTITGGYVPIQYGGGGMHNSYSSPTVANCIFTNNSADMGGGIDNYYSSPRVTNCTFTDNSAHWGCGIFNYNSNPIVTNCAFSDNCAAIGGGGICNFDSSSPVVTNCTFSDNGAGYGGGMMNSGSSPTVTNCTFIGNCATWGGGMDNSDSNLTVTNCTFTRNWADFGGAMDNDSCTCVVTNCIFWCNHDAEVYAIITYSNVQGGFPGEGNIDANPLLDATGHLQAGSPCIDAGNSADVPAGVTTDLDGNPRIQGAGVDMGAYESAYEVRQNKQ